MLNINLITNYNKPVGDGESSESLYGNAYLEVNGILDQKSDYDTFGGGFAVLFDTKAIAILVNHKSIDIGKFIEGFKFEKILSWWSETVELQVRCQSDYRGEKFMSLTLPFLNWKNWAKTWSIEELLTEFQLVSNLYVNQEFSVSTKRLNYKEEIVIVYKFDDSNNIGFEIEKLVDFCYRILVVAEGNLSQRNSKESLITYFNFPDDVKATCTQYLIYFGQFLSDLGIDVETEIKSELRETLFKITPVDSNEGLEYVRKALELYLKFPDADGLEYRIAENNDQAILQLMLTCNNFKSQLMLAKTTIQLKDTVIEMLQISNNHYKQIIEDGKKEDKMDKEELVKGIIEIKKYEGDIININFAEIIRRLKRKRKK